MPNGDFQHCGRENLSVNYIHALFKIVRGAERELTGGYFYERSLFLWQRPRL